MLPRLVVLAAAAILVSGQLEYALPPALQAAQDSTSSIVVSEYISNYTDASSIVQTASIVDQKTGAPSDDTLPGLPQASTKLTALDGQLMDGNIPTVETSTSGLGPTRRLADDYELVFSGTQDGVPDAAIEGTAYLTFYLVPNTTYDAGLDACFAYCDGTAGCVFFNIYRELNNPYLDFVFAEQSNLKCVLYGDVHTAAEKTNSGGVTQHDALLPSMHSVIESSTGYALRPVEQPADPEGYKLAFGPLSAANNAPGYMGFAFISTYDVAACAALCNTRGADPAGGACKFFNIWRAVIHGNPTTYTCAMYSAATNASTATNTGQGDLQVTLSRGYARISYIIDGTFEDYVCDDQSVFCFSERAPGWIGSSSSSTGHFDATIFHYAPYAHTGSSVALLGSAFGSDPFPGLLRSALAIAGLTRGRTYVLGFFHSSTYSGFQLEQNSFVSVWWGGSWVGNVTVGYSSWGYFEFKVTAGKNNTLAFIGGQAPAYDFIDDVNLFLI
ncbi:hypothetical protein C8F01DRAFT_705737 [Mycena amicta]|nr:hypothetical protein C8F01DRAFT_705737 [Mycena amicta]